MVLHSLVIYNVVLATDERISAPHFWKVEAWVAFAVWFRFLIQYMREIKTFSWIIGLIIFCAMQTTTFLVIYLVSVTAFADIFNAVHQGKYLEEPAATSLDQVDISMEKIFRDYFDDW